ncbi:MAG: hypothetical protein LBR45_05005, partial [Bacteroidales bacterium]|jgi:hypothetical protein|nr:hypothetical protein [Bacteroidales bacterium]
LPDYPLPFTLEEIDFENGDAILNYALKLIEDGKYIKESEEFEIDIVKMICLIAAGFVVVGAASLLFYNYNRKRKIKNKKHL